MRSKKRASLSRSEIDRKGVCSFPKHVCFDHSWFSIPSRGFEIISCEVAARPMVYFEGKHKSPQRGIFFQVFRFGTQLFDGAWRFDGILQF